MSDQIVAIAKLEWMQDKGDRISSLFKLVPQEGFDTTINDNYKFEKFILKGEFKFGTRYEIVIREVAQQSLPLEGRVFREEEEEEIIIVPASPPIFNRPKEKSFTNYEPSDYDNDTDINI